MIPGPTESNASPGDRGRDHEAPPPIEVSPETLRLHHDAIVIDAHADTPSEFFLREGYDFGARHDEGHIDLPRLREGGIDLQFMIAWVPAELAEIPGASFEHAKTLIAAIWDTAERTAGTEVITNLAGLHRAREANQVALMIGVEGGHAIENSIQRLHELHQMGARYLTLTWNNSNDWADSATERPRNGGLTKFGREVIRELNHLRMIVDLSHVARTTFYHTLETTTAPPIASHSCARALAESERNLDDEQIRDLAAIGGVIGINYFPAFLDTEHGRQFEELEERTAQLLDEMQRAGTGPEVARRRARRWRDEQRKKLPPVPIDKVIDHIEWIIDIAGIDHVALGSDFDGIATTPIGLPDTSAVPAITQLLGERGYHDDELRKILGGNLIRIIRETIG